MKLTPKEIECLVVSVVGKDALAVLRLIKNKKNVSEFKLAEKMKLNVNQIRNVLYRMNEHNLVGFTRKKDKKKGWYIYYWTFDEKQARNLYIFLKKKRLNDLNHILDCKSQQETFFVCKADFVRFNVNEALENEFKCPECGRVLAEEQVVIDFNSIRKEINTLETDLGLKAVGKIAAPSQGRRVAKPKFKPSKSAKVTKKAK